jgi:hypothetical protein
MSGSANYSFVFWSGSADYYFEWNVRLDSISQSQTKRQIFCYSEPLKNARKYSFVNIGSTYYSVLKYS